MAQLIKVTKKEAMELMGDDCEFFLLLSHDLCSDKSFGKKRISNHKGKVLIADSKTIVLNKDIEDDDAFSILHIYTVLQRDIRDIVPKGIKHDMILFPSDIKMLHN